MKTLPGSNKLKIPLILLDQFGTKNIWIGQWSLSWVAQELQILCFNCYSKNFEHHTLLSKITFSLESLRLKLFNTLTNANTYNFLAVNAQAYSENT